MHGVPDERTRVSLDIKARIEEAISIQRDRVYWFKKQKEPCQRDYNDAVRVLTLLLKEARGAIKDAVKWSRALSPEERREAIVAWFGDLPRQQKHQLLEELMRRMERATA